MRHTPAPLIAIIILSLAAVIVLPVYTFSYLYPAVTGLIIAEREKDARQMADHLAHMYGEAIGESGIGAHLQQSDFPATVEKLRRSFGLVKVKVFAPSGEIIYSTDPDDIGTVNTRSYFTNIVAHGGKYTKVIQKDHRTLEGQTVRRDVVETYAPLMDGDRFLGAFELYYDITDSKAELHRLLTTTLWIVSLITLGLLAGVIVATLQARRFLRLRDAAEARLRQANRDLSLLLDFASRINKTLRLEELLPQAFNTLLDLDILAADRRGGIFLIEGDRMHLAFHSGHDKEFLAAHQDMRVGDCLCGRAAATGELLVSPSCFSDPHHTIKPAGMADHGHVILPLKAMNETVGVLFLYTAPHLPLEPNKLQLLEALGTQLGIMIKNAQLYETTKNLSLHDPLTGLANRRFLEVRLRQELHAARRYQRGFAILLFDIDHFKQYNDTHGHEAGDRLLTKVAKVITSVIRDTDFAARYGGEEFLVILGDDSCDHVCQVADRLRRTVADTTAVTISIGVSTYQPDTSTEELIRCADQALYHAKDQGRNRAFVWTAPGTFVECRQEDEAAPAAS